jgi:hypothetical protein
MAQLPIQIFMISVPSVFDGPDLPCRATELVVGGPLNQTNGRKAEMSF